MRKIIASVFLVMLLIGPVSGETFYDITIGNETIQIDTQVQVECEENCPVSAWRFDWRMPVEGEIKYINDSIGAIEDYEVNDQGIISLESNTGTPSEREVFEMRIVAETNEESLGNGLKTYEFNLPGFEGTETSGIIRNDEVWSGWIAGSGTYSIENNEEMRFNTVGPTSVRANYGTGKETDYYVFFGEEEVYKSDLAMELAIGLTGLTPHYEKLPVVLVDSLSYDESFRDWSAGRYEVGTVTLRSDLPKEEQTAVLAHETVHSLNSDFLSWDETDSVWFDEGVATYAEFLIKEELNVSQGDLFGEDYTFIDDREDGRYQVTIPKRGNPDDLWRYYRNEDDFVRSWHHESSPEVRDFGYAYSELILRNHVVNKGNVSSIYDDLSPRSPVNDVDGKWSLFEELMVLEPCNYGERDHFDDCLTEINDYDYELILGDFESGDAVEVDKIQRVNRTSPDVFSQNGTFTDVLSEEQALELSLILQEMKFILAELLGKLTGLLGNR